MCWVEAQIAIYNRFLGVLCLRALYISSSTPESSNSSASLLKNQSDTMHSPVFFSTDISRFVGEAGAGKMIEETIRKWRTETPFSNGFEVRKHKTFYDFRMQTVGFVYF